MIRMYTCCPREGCGTFQRGLRFLTSWGIEPEIGVDDEGHYFQFTIPRRWARKRSRKFKRALNKQVTWHEPTAPTSSDSLDE
jgi:hypothetical protein